VRLTERNLWNRIKGYLPGVVDRVENVAHPGFTDISGACGSDYWVELKVTTNKSNELIISTMSLMIMLQPSQVVWIRKRLHHGSKVFILIKTKSSHLLLFIKGWSPGGFLFTSSGFGNKKEDLQRLGQYIKEQVCHVSL
jgi:hypothetical protein